MVAMVATSRIAALSLCFGRSTSAPTVTQAIANIGFAPTTPQPIIAQSVLGSVALTTAKPTVVVKKLPAQGYWDDVADSACLPMNECTGDGNVMNTTRGICVGPYGRTCSLGSCLCKDVCNSQHTAADYVYADYPEANSVTMNLLVTNARNGGDDGIENIKCPRATRIQSDSVICGADNKVGQTCGKYPVAQCADDTSTGQVECWDICDTKHTVEQFGSLGTKAARQSVEYHRSASCWTPWYIVLGRVLLFLACIGFCILGALWVRFNMNRKKGGSKQQQYRGLNTEQEMPQRPNYAQAPMPMEDPPTRIEAPQYHPEAQSHGSMPSHMPPLAQAHYVQTQQYSTMPQAPSQSSHAMMQPNLFQPTSTSHAASGTYVMPNAGYQTQPGTPAMYATNASSQNYSTHPGAPAYGGQPGAYSYRQ